MEFNTEENRQILINSFRCLEADKNFFIIGNKTPVYNCIAWAMGYTDRWVEGINYFGYAAGQLPPGHYWPDGVRRGENSEDLVNAFIAEGFSIPEKNELEEGYDYVALYHRRTRFLHIMKWTHASKIINNEKECSKFGQSFLALHSHNIFSEDNKGEEKSQAPQKPSHAIYKNNKAKMYLHNLVHRSFHFMVGKINKRLPGKLSIKIPIGQHGYGEVFLIMRRKKTPTSRSIEVVRQIQLSKPPIEVNEELFNKRFQELFGFF